MEIINFSIIQSLFWIFIISLKLEYSEFDTKKKKDWKEHLTLKEKLVEGCFFNSSVLIMMG